MGTWLPDFQPSQPRTVWPKRQVIEPRQRSQFGFILHLAAVVSSPSWSRGVTSGRHVSFKKKKRTTQRRNPGQQTPWSSVTWKQPRFWNPDDTVYTQV